MTTTAPGGTITPAEDLTLSRMGFGAMQLAGPGVFGPPRDHDEAIAVLREAVERGITHIDTADFYGPHLTNQLIREALYPYPAGLHIVTKVGAVRDAEGAWVQDREPAQLRAQVHDNLRNLGVDVLDVVNLRVGGGDDGHSPVPGPIGDKFGALAQLQQEGLIRHLGLSTVDAAQVAEAQAIAPVVTVQNFYNVARREDDQLLDDLAGQGIAYVPYFPLGGFTPLQSGTLDRAAARIGATPQQTALAWLLQRSPAIALIPGTSSLGHLRENIAAAGLVLGDDVVKELDSIAGEAACRSSRPRAQPGRGAAASQRTTCSPAGGSQARKVILMGAHRWPAIIAGVALTAGGAAGCSPGARAGELVSPLPSREPDHGTPREPGARGHSSARPGCGAGVPGRAPGDPEDLRRGRGRDHQRGHRLHQPRAPACTLASWPPGGDRPGRAYRRPADPRRLQRAHADRPARRGDQAGRAGRSRGDRIG